MSWFTSQRIIILCLLSACISFDSHAQFWFGPKVGVQMVSHSYQNENFKTRYAVDNDVNWHAGLTMQYTTDQRFAVHTELLYQKVRNRVQNKVDSFALDNFTDYNFLTTAMHARLTFGNGVVRFFGIAGPRIGYWLGGSGFIDSAEGADNFGVSGGPYDIVFKDDALGAPATELVITRPNRIQYGLDIGGGAIMDLATGQRLVAEIRYNIGHSNMGFNDDVELIPGISYMPDIQFANDMFMFSLSYLFGYDPTDSRKGSSTNKLSNKAKK